MAFSPADDRLVEVFEQLLRSGVRAVDLQDRLMKALQWAEGRAVNAALLRHLEYTARDVLRRFLLEQPFTAVGRTPNPSCADDLVVTFDEDRRITLQLPTEVRQWLLANQSMIST